MAKGNLTILFLLIIFIAEFVWLSFISNRSWFWTDEVNSVYNALQFPWIEYLKGECFEGNSAPLYYLLIKVALKIQRLTAHFHINPVFIMRLVAILPASLFTSLVAREFLKTDWRLKYWAAIAMILALNSTHTLLGYGWQARQYSLWVLATWFVMKSAWIIVEKWPNPTLKHKFYFYGSFFFLSTISGMAFLQLCAVSAFLYLATPPRIKGNFRQKIIFLAPLIPILVYSLFIATRVPPMPYIWPGISHFAVLIAAHAKYWMILPILIWLWKKPISVTLPYALNIGLLSATACLVIFSLFLHRARTENGFEISERYFSFLLPSFCFLLSASWTKWQKSIYRIFFCIVLITVSLPKLITATGQLPSSSQRETVEDELRSVLSATSRCYCFHRELPEFNRWGAHMLEFRNIVLSQACNNYLEVKAIDNPNVRVHGIFTLTGRTSKSANNQMLCDE